MMINDESYILTNFEYALESKNIKPFFQPIVRNITGEVCAVETLARWEDPIRGLITPNVFIEILEKHDLIPKAEGYEYMFSLQKFADTDLPMINCFYDHSNKTENYHE